MSASAIKWARKHRAGGPAETAVLLIIALESDRLGMSALSVAEIAEAVNTDRSTTRRILGRLRDRGLVSWERATGGERNTYRLPLAAQPCQVGGLTTH